MKEFMALMFQPKVGSVLMCSFEGFVEPEMVKRRPVVVIARNKGNCRLVTVVPLSTTEPDFEEAYHYQLPTNPVPAYAAKRCWAKCDMVATVSIERMDRLKNNKRERVVPVIADRDLKAIRLGVVNALQLRNTIVANNAAHAVIEAAEAISNAEAPRAVEATVITPKETE